MREDLIKLADHCSDWSDSYASEASVLRAALPDELIAIHHIGSTAVPGIKAKPIIDIAIESNIFPANTEVVRCLSEMQYVERGESSVPGRNWFSKGEPRTVNLHWCPRNGIVIDAQIRFRDALIADPSLAIQYERLKIAAAPGRGIDSSEYANAKSRFITKVLAHG